MAEPANLNNETISLVQSRIAQQIIDEFLSTLESCEGYAEIAQNLRVVIANEKITEDAIKKAILNGDDIL